MVALSVAGSAAVQKITTLVLSTLMSCSAFAQKGDEIRCAYERKVECGPARCRDSHVHSAYLLLTDLDALVTATIRANGVSDLPSIRRCDPDGCTPVVIRATRSGAFVNIAGDSSSYLLKVLATDLGEFGAPLKLGDFLEVTSLYLRTATYFGSCSITVAE
jgi:hypothetical protein